MQRVSLLRLTAESSSVLGGEETGCPEIVTHKSYYTQPYVAVVVLNEFDIDILAVSLIGKLRGLDESNDYHRCEERESNSQIRVSR